MIRPSLSDLNPLVLKYYPFMISLDKCNGSSNIVFPKICASKEIKGVNVKAFNMIPDKNEA